MDTPLDALIDKLENLPDALYNFGIDELKETDLIDLLIAFNQKQMEAGLRPDGSPISPDYTAVTVEIKQSKGQIYDRVTLHDKGDFYSSERAMITGDSIVLIDNDWKTEQLLSKYGEVLGVSEENLQSFISLIKPDFISFARKYFGID